MRCSGRVYAVAAGRRKWTGGRPVPKLMANLELPRCPHCNVDTPNLSRIHQAETRDHSGSDLRRWFVYACTKCGGLVTASSRDFGGDVLEVFPASWTVEEDLPPRAKSYLEQAVASKHAPAGAVMLAASAVDAMLKEKGYAKGSLFDRIEKAAADALITADMAKWAHEVRLDANDQRHADEVATLPTSDDGARSIEFASALGTFMFTLPARVRRGIKASERPVS